MLTAGVAGMPGCNGDLDLAAIAAATEGFTGADLGRLVDDARALVLADLAASRPVGDLTRIFLTAVEEVRRNMSIIQAAAAQAESRPVERREERFHGMPGNGDDTPPSA
jgi:SpoVK/Ycf46/Vps4 family AAA+-type ATPase